jgi:anthranilate synthase/aminodeoxychorismate synthase-like glutamine amidotransferase
MVPPRALNGLVIDAYDSFVYILFQYLRELGVLLTVRRCDRVSLAEIESLRPDFILLSPGPGHPAETNFPAVIRRFGSETPIFGVCLGHQAVGLAYGGRVTRASRIKHGKTSPIRHDGRTIFHGIPSPTVATRYHSLIVEDEGLPDELEVSSTAADDGYVMGLRHRRHPVESVQFHPESVLTEHGKQILINFLDCHVHPRLQTRERADH